MLCLGFFGGLSDCWFISLCLLFMVYGREMEPGRKMSGHKLAGPTLYSKYVGLCYPTSSILVKS